MGRKGASMKKSLVKCDLCGCTCERMPDDQTHDSGRYGSGWLYITVQGRQFRRESTCDEPRGAYDLCFECGKKITRLLHGGKLPPWYNR
jgi:hypothetical protein